MTQPGLTEEPVSEVYENDDLDAFIAETDTAAEAVADGTVADSDDFEAETPEPDGEPDTGEAPALEVEPEPAPVPERSLEDRHAELEAEVTRLNARDKERQQANQDAELQRQVTQEIARRAEELETTEYLSPEVAQRLAKSETEMKVAQAQSAAVYKQSLALQLSKDSGVPVEMLMQYNDEASMRVTATTMGPIYQSGELLKKQALKNKKDTIPAQNYDQQATSRAGAATDDQMLDRYIANPNSTDPGVQAAGRRAALGR